MTSAKEELSQDELSQVSGGEDGGQYAPNKEELSADDLSKVAGGADGGQYRKKPNEDITELNS